MPAFLLLFNNVLQSKEWTKDQKSGCPLPVAHTWYFRLNRTAPGRNNLRWIPKGQEWWWKWSITRREEKKNKQHWIINNSITNTKHDNVIICTVHIRYYSFLFLTVAFILIIWASCLNLRYYKSALSSNSTNLNADAT